MLRLIFGRAGAGKTGLIYRELAERVRQHRPGGLLVVPEQYSHEAERELAMSCGDEMSLYAEVLSFTRLAHRAAQDAGGSARTYVDAGGRLLQLALALEQTGGALGVYGGAVRSAEQMSRLLSALDELRAGRADPDALRAAARTEGGPLGDKLMDLALLRQAMDALEEQTGADPASRLEVLTEQIPRCAMLEGAAVYLDGFTDFTAQERAVIRALWRRCDVTVCLTCDSLSDGSEVFSGARRTAALLRDAAREDGMEAEILNVSPSAPADAGEFLEAHLFDWTDETFPAGDAVRLFTARSPQAECELAAGEILRLVRETGCRWRDVAVAVRGFEDYRGVLGETFRRYGIPLYASAKTDILTRPLPALMGAAFDALSDGWSYESVFTYLKTGLTGLSRDDCDILENYVLTWNIRGSAWTREAPWQQHPEGYNAEVTPESQALLARIDALRRSVAEPLARFGRSGARAADALGQCRAVARLWDDIDLPGHLEERADALERAGEEQTAAEYRQLWELMVSALEQCAAVLGSMPMDQETFGKLFRRMLSEYDVGTIPVALDQVTAGDFDRMRRRRIRHLLVLGCCDDRLPRLDRGAGVFTDAERDRLRELHIDLADSDALLDREFNLIYNVFTLPGESLYVSRSLFAADGSETRPAFVTDRLCRLFGVREQPGDLAAARLSAPGPAMELAVEGDPRALARFAADPEARERLEALRASAAFVRGRLGREAVRALYGDKLWLTASRVDNFASCRFQYFLRYGLKARPRQAADFAPPELGTFLHYLLENVAREVSSLGGFAAVEDEQVAALTDRFAGEYVHSALEDFREKTPRFRYLFRRLTQTARRIVLDTAAELRRSDFVPLDFELNFSEDKDMPPVTLGEGDAALVLTGVADRVDGWDHNGKLYLRVVDYKSGRKKFSLTDVWYGMGLQMLLYLFSLEKNGRRRYGKEIVPAGVLYVPARDVLVSAPERLSDEEILKEKAKSLRRSGLLLSDPAVLSAMEHSGAPVYIPVNVNRQGEYAGDALASAEQLSHLSAYVDELLQRMAREVRSGSIAADPWYAGESENTCLYCDYFDACHFDEKTDGWRCRASLKPPEFWQRIDPELPKEVDEHAAD